MCFLSVFMLEREVIEEDIEETSLVLEESEFAESGNCSLEGVDFVEAFSIWFLHDGFGHVDDSLSNRRELRWLGSLGEIAESEENVLSSSEVGIGGECEVHFGDRLESFVEDHLRAVGEDIVEESDSGNHHLLVGAGSVLVVLGHDVVDDEVLDFLAVHFRQVGAHIGHMVLELVDIIQLLLK